MTPYRLTGYSKRDLVTLTMTFDNGLTGLREAIINQLWLLTEPDMFWADDASDVSETFANELASEAWSTVEIGSLIGTITPYIGESAPPGYLLCDGAEYNQADYPLLMEIYPAALKTVNTFFTPDLRGRVVAMPNIGSDILPPFANSLYSSGGSSEITLSESQMPSHTHTSMEHTHYQAIGIEVPALVLGPGEVPTTYNTGVPTVVNVSSETVIIRPSGGGAPHSNVQPTYILNYIMRVI